MHEVYDLYILVMNVELGQLCCLVAIVETGSFADAAIDLGISQAAASRTLASLESAQGVRLLRRTTRDVTLTAAGSRVLAHARRALAAAEDVVREAAAGPARLRIGYAWSAMGRHTTPFQRRWAADHPDVELALIRTNSGPAGPDLWPPGARPAMEYTGDIDDGLTAIATGRYVGVTPESTVTQYPRPGIAYRPLRDAPPVPVRLVWWRDDAHPATAAAVGLLTSLFRQPSR
jgi:DNA-binding transcriptional LysR family regulator